MRAPSHSTLVETGIAPNDVNFEIPWAGGTVKISTPMEEWVDGSTIRGQYMAATNVWLDPDGGLWIGRRKAAGRPDAGRPCALRALTLEIQIMAPGATIWEPRMKEVHSVHLRVTSADPTAADVRSAAEAVLAGFTPDQGYVAAQAARLQYWALRAQHKAAEEAADLERARERVRTAKILLAQQEGQDPELKMLLSQPRKGEGWAKAWHRTLKRWAAAHLGWVSVSEEEAQAFLRLTE